MFIRKFANGSLFVFLLLFCATAWSACEENSEVSCTVGGLEGLSLCVGGRFLPCSAIEEEILTGQVRPNFLVVTVLYAPPGSATGSPSSVSYGAGSTTGVATSASLSFKNETSVAYSGTLEGKGFTGGIESSFAFSSSSSTSSVAEITKSETSVISTVGAATDGVNHDRDVIYLWLNPLLNVEIQGDDVRWSFAQGDSAVFQFLFVDWLKNPEQVPANVMARLVANDVTIDDFPAILARNPAALGEALDPERYEKLLQTFPYQPPLDNQSQGPVNTLSLEHTEASSTTFTDGSSYSVGAKISAGVKFASAFGLKAATSNKWTWSNLNSRSTSESNKQSSTLTITSPSVGYTGSTLMEVYFDKEYGTFLFRPAEQESPFAVTGTVFDSDGTPKISQEVELLSDGRWHRTLTDIQGRYRFPSVADSELILKTVGQQWTIPATSIEGDIDLTVSDSEFRYGKNQDTHDSLD